jgi:hypothetical protein
MGLPGMTQFFNLIVDAEGTSITLSGVAYSGRSNYGTPTITTTDATVVAVVQVFSGADDEVKEGAVQTGDIRAFFKADITGIAKGNQITYQSKKYEIVNFWLEQTGSEGHFYEVHAKRIS